MEQVKGIGTMNKTEKFKQKANSVHGSIYNYDKVKYISVDTKVEIVCSKHGSFFQSPRVHLYKKGGCNTCAVERSIETNAKTTEQFIQEAKQVHGDEYNYSKSTYVNANTPVTIICKVHGEFQQKPTVHISKHAGCPKCNQPNRDTQEDFIRKARIVHTNKYDYSKANYTVSTKKVKIVCPTHGEFEQQAQSHIQGCGCPVCGTEQYIKRSKAERTISQVITDLGHNTLTGSRSVIPPLELDIFIPDSNIAFEFNGVFWHSELGGKNQSYHLGKTLMCEEKNIRLIHIFESEWINQKDIVLSRIQTILGHSNRIHARKCSIEQINTHQAKEFLNQTHIQGFSPSLVYYGLIFDGRLVSLMTFGKSRFNKNIQWELIRFSNVLGHTVVGGASKLFKHFLRIHAPSSVISYSDKRWNTGNLYEKIGFTFSHSSKPNYYYFSQKSTTTLLSRIQFQKHKLKDKLDIFDPSISEWENMKNNGYNRIWDCGNDVFVWENEITQSL